MFHKLVPYTRLHFMIQHALYLHPYHWPANSPKAIKLTPRAMLACKIIMSIEYIYTLIMVLNFLITLGNNNTTEKKIFGWIVLNCLVASLAINSTFLWKEDEGLQMLNSFLQFEVRNSSMKTTKADLVGKLIMILGIVTSFNLPTFVVGIYILDPCNPPGIGYILYKSQGQCHIPENFQRGLILLFEGVMWFSIISPVAFNVFHFYFLGVRCMTHYISQTWNNLKKQELRFLSAFHSYRQIHLLNGIFDDALQTLLIPATVMVTTANFSISLYSCLKLHRKIPPPALAFFILIAMDTSSILLIVKLSAGVLTRAGKFLASCKKNEKLGMIPGHRREVRALEEIKVRFGSSNFFDERTALVIFDFCMNNIVNLMLIT